MRASRLHRLSLVCALSALVPSTDALAAALNAAQAVGLLARDSSKCPDPALVQCTNVDFCCAKNTKCVPLANGASVICCPAGQDCELIQPVLCDISQQNATLYPLAPIHTTNLSQTLSSCSNACCPLGYNCENDLCVRDGTTPGRPSAAPSGTGKKSSPTQSLTGPLIVPTFTTPPDSAATLEAACSQFPATAVVLGLVAGAFLGVGATLLAQYLLGRHRRRKTKSASRYSADFMGQTPAMDAPVHRTSDEQQMLQEPRPFLSRSAVSAPVLAPSYGALHRTDFLLRHDSAQSSRAGSSHTTKPSYSSTHSATAVDTATPATQPPRDPALLDPHTPSPHQQHARSASASASADRPPPLFPSPLRLGLPSTPAPTRRRNSPSPPPSHPARSSSSARRSAKSPARTPAAAADTPGTVPPAATPSTAATAATPPSFRRPAAPTPQRQHQQQALSSTSSLIQDDSDSAGSSSRDARATTTTTTPARSREPSTETINVLMPGLEFAPGGERQLGTPFGGGTAAWGRGSAQTTFSAFVDGAAAGAGVGGWQPRRA